MKAGFLLRGWLRRFLKVWCLGTVAVLGFMAAGAGAEEAAGELGVPGYLRVDTDRDGTQFWFGATHSLRGLDIGSNIYLANAAAELDIGPLFEVGESLVLQPMVGAIFDFESAALASLVPQFYLYWTLGSWYLESWQQVYVGLKDEYRPHWFYHRTFLLYSLGHAFSLGPQTEFSFDLEERDGGKGLTSLAVGGTLEMAYGKNNTLGLFLGYETRKEAREGNDGMVGRFTFIRQW